MGGKKKLGIKQMEKQQADKAEDDKAKKKEEKKGPPQKKTTVGVLPPDARDQKIVAEVKKMGVLTPYAVSTRYGIRISAAKDFLEQLEATGAVQLVSGSHNLKVYKPAA